MANLKNPGAKIDDIFEPRAIGDGDPEVYTREELKILVKLGLQYGRGVLTGRRTTAAHEQAEVFRRKVETIHIFRGLPERLRKRPTGQATKDAVLNRLKAIGIKSSETTLARDYRALGGAKWLSGVKPFAPGENSSSPFLVVTAKSRT